MVWFKLRDWEKRRIVALREQRLTIPEIARKLDRGESTVKRVLSEHKKKDVV